MEAKKLMKIIALLIAMLMVFTMAACSDSDSEGKKNDSEEVNETPDTDDEGKDKIEVVEDEDILEDENLRYVMIYNPGIYDENAYVDKSSLKTGYLGTQVDADSYRADGPDDEELPMFTYPQDLLIELTEELEIESNRADISGKEYSVGDFATFYAPINENLNSRYATPFKCVYEGQYCYIWADSSTSQSAVKAVADTFDANVYETVTETFGPARFDASAGKNGKINIVFTNMGSSTLGVHYMYDVYATGELSSAYASRNQINLDHDILFVNSLLLGNSYYEKNLYSTLAHEFQHLVIASAAVNTYNQETFCSTWFNEAMSGYIEDMIYPGIQEEAKRPKDLMKSKLIRNGQSLYNFKTSTATASGFDIGVYGSVYVFSEYLADLAGDDVFSNFHEYWRESYSDTICVSEALVNSVPTSVKTKIDKSVVYPDSLDFESEDEEWMSKLALDFYLSMLAKEGNLEAYKSIKNSALLYDEINGAEIEGGGRIIVAVDSKFEIPEDADSGLIYVGLDENFEPVTSFVYK